MQTEWIGFFAAPLLEEVEPIHKWIGEKDGIIAYSIYGKLRDELTGIKKAKFQEMARNGRAITYRWYVKIRLGATTRFLKISNCKSEVHVHILALAKVSRQNVFFILAMMLVMTISEIGEYFIVDNPIAMP